MTKKQALAQYKELFLPNIIAKYGKKDLIAIREDWKAYTDSLCRNGFITEKQCAFWCSPL